MPRARKALTARDRNHWPTSSVMCGSGRIWDRRN